MADFLFLANDASLDFVNTEVMLAGARVDLLRNFEDLMRWFEQASLAAMPNLHGFAKVWTPTPEAKAAFREVRALRTTLRNSVERVATGGTIPNALAGMLTEKMQQPRLATDVIYSLGRLTTRPRWILEKPKDLLVVLAHQAANFFATANYSSLRKCENPDCLLYFCDTSKNHTRRWCSMDLCGNRAKVAAFRKRL